MGSGSVPIPSMRRRGAVAWCPVATKWPECSIVASCWVGRWRNRWADRAYVPRPKLRKLSEARRVEVLGQLHQGIEDSPVLSALGWTVHARRGQFYFEEAGEVVGRITPTGRNMLLLEVEGRSSWHEEAKTPSASAVVEHVASDAEGTFHGLGPRDAVLREHGSERLELTAADCGGDELKLRELRKSRELARRLVEDVERYTAVPDSAPTDCRCDDPELALPAWLAEQTRP